MTENLINAFNDVASGVIGLNVQMYQSEPDKILIQFKQVPSKNYADRTRDYFFTLDETAALDEWVNNVIKYSKETPVKKTQDALAVELLNCYLQQCGIKAFHAELAGEDTKWGWLAFVNFTDGENIVDYKTLENYRFHYGVTLRADADSKEAMIIERRAAEALYDLSLISWVKLVHHLDEINDVPRAPNIWKHLVHAIGRKLKHVDKFTL